jgi:threonine aldolase
MAEAEVGDDVYGEDPSVNELEGRAAELAGKEAALFVPSGSMANLIAQMIHCRRGDEVLVGADSHCMLHEVGAGAAIAGVQYRVAGETHQPVAEQLSPLIKKPTFHTPGTGLVWLENTHNMAGGAVMPLEQVRDVREMCDRHDLPLHMDGARVFNAVAATGNTLAETVEPADSFSFCLSKGLGAPAGSLLLGSARFRVEAHRLRKMLGGGMRQAGVLAAAGLYALENHAERLVEDHENARYLAGRLAEHERVRVPKEGIDTNIVILELLPGLSAKLLERKAGERGVLLGALDDRRIRLVTHLDVSRKAIDAALPIMIEEIEELPLA